MEVPVWLRPRIQRVATYRIDHLPQSEVSFKKGFGVVGRCIELGPTGVMQVKLDSPTFRNAMKLGADAWANHSVDLTQNLTYKQAETLARRYGQVAAKVIQEGSGEVIGCITVEVPPRDGAAVAVTLRRPSGKPVVDALKSAATHVETHLTSRAKEA